MRAFSFTILGWVAVICAGLLAPSPLPGQRIEDLVNIQFVIDVRVFAFMAAINAAGFDRDAGELDNNPARKRAREWLGNITDDLRSRLRSFYASDSAKGDLQNQSRYVSLALLVRGPPSFDLRDGRESLPEDVRDLVGFEKLVAEVWREAELAELWMRVSPLYEESASRYRQVLRSVILETLRYLRTEPRISLDRRVVLIPDLMNAYEVVNARNMDSDYLVVVGPSRGERMATDAIRHEYLHFLLDPLVAKYSGYLPEDSIPFMDRVRRMPKADSAVRESFLLVVGESLVRMVEVRLGNRRVVDEELLEAYDRGFILAPYMSESLAEFEGIRDSIVEFMPKLIRGIEWRKERDREKEIGLIRAKLEQREDQLNVEEGRVTGLLKQANDLIASGNLSEAAGLLESVVALAPENANAVFGLAQIARRSEDLDGAVLLYRKAVELAGLQVWIAGWARVQMGGIHHRRGDVDAARMEWMEVLRMEGDLRGAREAARRALDQTGNPQ